MKWTSLIPYGARTVSRSTPSVEIVSYKFACRSVKTPLRLAFLSDIHFGRNPPPAGEIADSVNSLDPTHVIFGGDIASESSGLDDAFSMLSKLKSSHCNFAVIGNWELKRSRCKNISYWRTKFHGAGFTLLHDGEAESAGCVFHGLAPSRGQGLRTASLDSPTGKPLVVIAHNPDDIVRIKSRFDLGLAGHTHAGQIRLPLVGALKTSSVHWKKFEYGLLQRDDGAKLVVSSGLGTSCIPLRIFCSPEVVLTEITPMQS